jgi:hypothetical protein
MVLDAALRTGLSSPRWPERGHKKNPATFRLRGEVSKAKAKAKHGDHKHGDHKQGQRHDIFKPFVHLNHQIVATTRKAASKTKKAMNQIICFSSV